MLSASVAGKARANAFLGRPVLKGCFARKVPRPPGGCRQIQRAQRRPCCLRRAPVLPGRSRAGSFALRISFEFLDLMPGP